MKALSFFLVKYPQKSKVFISDELKCIIDEHNETYKPEYSILRRMEINFNPFQGTHKKHLSEVITKIDYTSKIKLLLNSLIVEAKTHFSSFKDAMKQVFII
jgi:hypothetical protein